MAIGLFYLGLKMVTMVETSRNGSVHFHAQYVTTNFVSIHAAHVMVNTALICNG